MQTVRDQKYATFKFLAENCFTFCNYLKYTVCKTKNNLNKF